MKKSRFSDEQIVKILREANKESVADVAKRHAASEQTIYVWRRRFGEMASSDVKRLKDLEQENARLRKLLMPGDLLRDRIHGKRIDFRLLGALAKDFGV